MVVDKAAAPEAIRARPVNTKTQNNPIPPARPAQECSVRLWRFLAWPRKCGVRCTNTTAPIFEALDRLLAGGEYTWLIAADGRMVAVVDGEFFEALRQAAYAYTPPLQSVYELSVSGTFGGAL